MFGFDVAACFSLHFAALAHSGFWGGGGGGKTVRGPVGEQLPNWD